MSLPQLRRSKTTIIIDQILINVIMNPNHLKSLKSVVLTPFIDMINGNDKTKLNRRKSFNIMNEGY